MRFRASFTTAKNPCSKGFFAPFRKAFSKSFAKSFIFLPYASRSLASFIDSSQFVWH